jgi:peptidoglycan/LPS O-acetylase OafA/YrhL
MSSGHKYQRLDSLRGLAALSVGVGHAFLCVNFSQDSSLQTAALGIFDGDYAVDLFFVLSGFVLVNMVRGFSGAHYAAYLGRRLLRLYPLLWTSLIVAYVTQAVVVAHAPLCGHLSFWICRLIRAPGSLVAAIETAIPVDFRLNPTSWTIKVEIAVSIIYPLVLAAWMKGGTTGKIATAAACTASIFIFSGHLLPHFVLLFVLGIAINDIRISNAWIASIAVGIALALMAVSGFFVRAHSMPADLIAGTSAALLIASVAYRCPGWLAALLDNRAVLKLGQISYAYYLLNPSVLWLIARANARWLSRLLVAGDDERAFLAASLLAACACAASVLVASAANRIIERPSIAWSRAAEQWILRLLGGEPRARAAEASR